VKKTTLLFVIALLGFPILTQTALMETELSFKIRNARGVYSFGTYHNGVGQTNLANGNLTLKRTILTRPGRAGLDLELAMYYNSKIWDRNANGMYVKDTGSKVGLGWYLGFPKLVQGASSYSMIFPDGSSHEIQQQNDGIWKSVDSTYIIYDPSISLATFKGGRKLHFGRVVGNTRYMTIMKDTNGNMIKASYASEGNLSYIMDTVGINGDKPAARFYYDSNGYLDYIQSFGMPHTTIRFSYQTADLYSSSRFSLPMQIPSGEKQLVSITTEMSDRNLIERFTYINGLGELGNVEKGTYMITSEEDRYDSITQYQYGTRSFADSTHTSVEERVVTNIAEYFGTTGYNTSLSYALDGNRTNPSQTTLTDIRGVTKYNFFSSLYPAKAWTDGLISSVQRKDNNLPNRVNGMGTRYGCEL
jgi:hypothetical protein